ncbi:Sodium/hydrogen exchanger [Macroventuria anomochaeta]|uniref:Sodium/hydrogen exchanger n=1 Tax=Macroventuria anomochaeta TaxID=301207 RepID=A0ACB6SAS9_9PLEO|nr:Sodium/hydrogen exchanger [Macroventuria anomochaeta]KAF2630339.1 Sodium/hydrogen exchanger [Macroventuria anomochaeta]
MAVASENAASLPYHEPGIVLILVFSSFLLLLNVINAILDGVLYCGLLGQVLIGIAWGTPGAKWLSAEVEENLVQLGYLGLILLVYEGGLHTSFQSLKANLLLSSGVALTGICIPIGLSYTLQGLLDATPVQAFAAGAALCSTSLGTTFTVLGSSGLSSSRLGVVLTSAAMMDDVVGLVMVQVISNLGGENFNAITIIRPVLVSIAFAVVAPVACLFVLKPVTLWLNRYRETHPSAALNDLLRKTQTAFTFHTALLVALVAGASYAGTSNLFAAYIAGATISWWDSEVPHTDTVTKARSAPPKGKSEATTSSSDASSGYIAGPSNRKDATASRTPAESAQAAQPTQAADLHEEIDKLCGAAIYEQYYYQAVSKILQPLFFASIGFSIPITRMFRGAIVWRGIVYTILMAFAKIVCGLWLVRLSVAPMKTVRRLLKEFKFPSIPHLWGKSKAEVTASQVSTTTPIGPPTAETVAAPSAPTSSCERRSSPSPAKPLSIHPPLILALAMCARGEIGFLISAVAESNGIFSPSGVTSSDPSDIFLVVTWAIVLCTIIGPLGVGLSVRRVKKLQDRKNKQQEGAGRDVLGVWGVE